MSHTRGMKPSKSKQALEKALNILKSIKKLEEAGALQINRSAREIWMIREMFWDNKDEFWRKNFLINLRTMMDINLKERLTIPIKIYAIDINTRQKGDYITTYYPQS